MSTMKEKYLYAPLPSPEEMSYWDRQSIHAYGVRNEMLMENASREAMAALREHFQDLRGARVLLFAGKGNNGGDAIALGRHLHDAGVEVLVLLTGAKKRYTGVSGYHLRLAAKTGTPIRTLGKADIESFHRLFPIPDIVVDGLFGTGFSGTPRPPFDTLIRAINDFRERAFVLALDIPSGLDGLTGLPSASTVKAHATVTFEAAKVGLMLPDAADYVGELHVRAIGIPAAVRAAHPPSCHLMTGDIMHLFPRPSATMHKGRAGRVCIIGGSPGLVGAPALAAMAALRAGAGLVTIACPAPLSQAVKHGHAEIMTLPLPSDSWEPEALAALKREFHRFDALVLGPGLGHDLGAETFVAELLSLKRPPTVVDADALNCLALRPDTLSNLSASDVLTPHPGEMSRLMEATGSPGDKERVRTARMDVAREFARQRNTVLVLKGAGSIVSGPDTDGQLFTALSPWSAPCLAVGGSGDILSGIIGNFLSRGLSALHAACLGVYWHGYTGRALEDDFPYRGNLAGEIAGALPRTLTELLPLSTEE